MTTPTLQQAEPERRIVCAALRIYRDDGADLIVTGARHYDCIMHGQIRHMVYLNPGAAKKAEQGFIDQWGKFLSRKEAFKVATEAGQIRHKSGNPDSKELFSEDLY